MESRKGRLIRSLRFRLCLFISVVGVAFTALICARSYYGSLSETETYVDEELSQIASVIVEYRLLIPKRWEVPMFKNGRLVSLPRRGMRDSFPLGPVPSLGDLFYHHQEIIIAPLYSNPGEPLYIPLGVDDGFYTFLIRDQRVRAYIATNHSGIRFVVARPMELVESLAKRALLTSLFEFLFLIAFFIPAVVILVSVMLNPVRRLAASLYRREKSDLRPLNAPVPSELDPLLGALNRLFRVTQESMQNERRFIADAAHEMRTPLTALSLKAQNFDEQGLSEAQLAKLNGIREAIRNQHELTSSLLTLARSQCADRHDDEMENIDIKELFIEILDILGELADAKDLDFGVAEVTVNEVYSVRRVLKTVLTNLCSNAIKYTPNGGQIDLCAKQQQEQVVICVKDNGPGIPEGELKKVFEPFYRVGGDTSKIQGTGLGLAIVKSSCAEIGARCEFSNRRGGGLCASVILPLKQIP